MVNLQAQKKALLIIDRGSREPEVREELSQICSMAKSKGGYDYADYCFLEVIPPFIDEGIKRCVDSGASSVTIVPYFLYPGMKLKDSVNQSARISLENKLKAVIAKPLSYHHAMAEVVRERITRAKNEHAIRQEDRECDVLLVGHGSSDKAARSAFLYVANALRPFYRNVGFCFLELDQPEIDQGIKKAIGSAPKVMIIMPYFLHRGAHIKNDVVKEVNAALQKYGFTNVYMTAHLGVDEKLVDLVIERAREVEKSSGIS